MWNRILGPSEAFVGKPGVVKWFFPTEPELSKRWPPPRYAVPEFPETGVEPPVPAGWPTAAQHEVHPQTPEVTSGTADDRSCYLRRTTPRRPDGTRLTRPERRVQWIRRVNEASRIRTFFDRGGGFLEVYAGSGRLTRALRKRGVRTLPAYDPFRGPRRSNLAERCSHRELVREVLAGPVREVYFGMPCTTFSAALWGVARLRSLADPVGPESVLKLAVANTLVRNMLQIIKLLTKTGGFWSIENPRSSLLWRFPGISELGGFTIDLDACAFGAKFPEKWIHQETDQDFHEPPGAAVSGEAVPWHAFAHTIEWDGAFPWEMGQLHQAGG